MTRAQGKHRKFSLNQSVATLYVVQRNIVRGLNSRGINTLYYILISVQRKRTFLASRLHTDVGPIHYHCNAV